MRLCNSHSVV